ncbi:alcohol dehydrogenase [Rhodococcus sp. SC4]|nr:alcohol dehydrogenase [Rhodococcus sp. SC4]
MKTKAAVLWELGEEWSIEDVELDAPKAHEVTVELAATGLCHSDDHARTGDMPISLPIVGGHEGAGVVVEVGPEVEDLKVGDHVVLSFMPACGKCKWCAIGRSNLCDLGALLMQGKMISDGGYRIHAKGQNIGGMSLLGTFSPYATVHEASAIKIHPWIPLDKAALVGCGVTTGYGTSVYIAKVKPGETVVVVGVGGIGAAAIQGARIAGAQHIVAIDPVAYKRDMALKLGATHTAESMEEAIGLVTDLTWGQMADATILTVGVARGSMIGPLLQLTSKGGRGVVTAVAPFIEVDNEFPLMEFTLYEKELRGTVFGGANARADIPKILSMYESGQILLDEMITQTYKLEEVNKGYDDMRAGNNVRGVILHEH